MKKFYLAWLIGFVCATLLANQALAHAKLIKSEPPADAKLTSAPKEVKLWFSEELDTKKSAIQVLNAKNEQVDLKDAKVNLNDRKQMTITLKTALEGGVYTVKWTSFSNEDGDEEKGEFKFSLQVATTPTPVPATPTAAPATATSAPAAPTSAPTATAAPQNTPAAATPTTVALAATAAPAPTTAPPAVATVAPLPTASASSSAGSGSSLVLPLIIGSLVLLGAGVFVALRRK